MRRALPFDYAAQNLARRPVRTLLTGSTCALVAALLVATTAFVHAIEQSFVATAEPDTVILLNTSSMKDVVRSAVSTAVGETVAADVAAVAKVAGVAAVSPEIHMASWVRPGGPDGERRQGFVRGVTERAFLVHPAVTLVDGRLAAGDDEVIVGRLAAARLGVEERALAPGAKLFLEGATFTIAGRFAAPGTTIESEIWAPLHRLRGLARREDVSAVFVRVASSGGLRELEHFATRRRDLELQAMSSASYYGEVAAYFAPLRALAWAMALLIGVAALLTGANTLSAAVQERAAEIATLRALGYRVGAIVASLLLESLLLAAAGAMCGLALARVAVSGSAVRLAMSAFELDVDATAIAAGLAGALVLGALGTLPAALRVARLEVARGLHGR